MQSLDNLACKIVRLLIFATVSLGAPRCGPSGPGLLLLDDARRVVADEDDVATSR